MANITIIRNKTLPNSSDKSDFHDLLDTATASITNIEQTDLASGIGTVVRQATAPSDTDQIWVDTSATPYIIRVYDGSEWIATGGYAVLTNKSGGQRTLGDVCVIDTTNPGAFTTTTLYGDPRSVVVVMETIDDNSDGVVSVAGGRVTNLKVDSAVAMGDWLATASTAARAAKSYVNSFATALASIGGSGTLAEALLNRNSLSVLSNASIPASGTSGQVLTTGGAGANPAWAANFVFKTYTFSRAEASGNGTVSLTGFGKTPKGIVAMGGKNGADNAFRAWGFYDFTNYAQGDSDTNAFHNAANTTRLLTMQSNAAEGFNVTATATADGADLTFTRVGSGSGTFSGIIFLIG